MSSIVIYPDSRLRKLCRIVTQEEIVNGTFYPLIDHLVQQLDESGGVGIAASQVGELVRILLARDTSAQIAKRGPKQQALLERTPFDLLVMYNPVITYRSQKTVFWIEGCLSIPGKVGVVERAWEITVEYTDMKGDRITKTLSGYPARIIQHEIDHHEGILYIDRMIWHSIMRIEEYEANWQYCSPDELSLAFAA